MADATSTAPEVTIEDVGPATKKLTITVPRDTVLAKLEESLGTLAADATLPGFRKGKAPRRLLEKRFGTQVREEARNQIIADAYSKAVEEHQLQPVGDPEPVDTDVTIEDDKPLTFAVQVEVMPEFELPDFSSLDIKKPQLEIGDDLIETELNRQLRRLGSASRVDGDFRPRDRIVCHATVNVEGKDEPVHVDDTAVLVFPEEGRGPVFGMMIEDLGHTLEGRRTGDTVTIETTGPEAHELEVLRGKKVTVTLRLAAAERPEPATIEQMIEFFGLGTEENLREQVKLALEHQRDEEQANAMREQVHEQLMDAVEFELPTRLSARQAARNLEGMRLDMLNRGMPPEQVEERLAELRADSETQSRQRLKLFFVLHRLAEALKVDVSEQEVNGRIAAIAARHGQRPEQLRGELARTGRLGEVARMVRDHKAVDQVIANAKVEEISADKWNELVRKKTEGKAASTKKKSAPRKTTKKKAGASK